MKSSISVTAKFCCHRNAPQIVTELHLPGPFCTESLAASHRGGSARGSRATSERGSRESAELHGTASRSSTTAAAARATTWAASTARPRSGPSAPSTARAPSPRTGPARSGSTASCSARPSAETSSTARSPCSSARTPGSRTAFPTRGSPSATSPRIPRALIVIDPRRRTRWPTASGCALRVSPADASKLGLAGGGRARLSTKRASVIVTVAVDDAMAAGHLALPNGLGLDHPEGPGRVRTGVAPNELTASEHRDQGRYRVRMQGGEQPDEIPGQVS
jgi:hypothetical protein